MNRSASRFGKNSLVREFNVLLKPENLFVMKSEITFFQKTDLFHKIIFSM